MAHKTPPESDLVSADPIDPETAAAEEEKAEETQPLELEVAIEKKGACERHVTVTIARADIDRYFDKEFTDLVKKAEVPGFRPGHTPRKLIETRFRKDVTDRVKGTLLMDAIGQATDKEDLSVISEPDLDVEAVKLPDEGPMTFEFDVEVRPEFATPQWKGLSIKRPVREFSAADVDVQLKRVLARWGRLIPKDGPAETGDYITVNLKFTDGDRVLSNAEEEVIRIRPTLSFRDGNVLKFDKLMAGVTAGETREGKAKLSDDAPNLPLRGKEVTATFEVLEVKQLELPELTPEFLESVGEVESEADLRDMIKDNLVRQLEYQQHQQAREQVTAALTEAAKWDLPQEMLKRQSRRELQRAVLELQRSGFSEEEIRRHENELRQHSMESTARALKEHFILERIAEDEEIEVDEADYNDEIALIATQTGDSARRVRARLEKGGMMDALHNQIIERKVIDKILAAATFKEVPYDFETGETEAIDRAAAGHDEDIPEAKPEGHEEHAEDASPTEA
ncbi:MAG TPA: trigger factor [Thermoguttaceae bacterium]|nr:trigger factor [Thermoguttaceae bacterium]